MVEINNKGHDVSENTEAKIAKNEVNETNEKTKQAALDEIEDDLKPQNPSEIKEQKDIGEIRENTKELTKQDYEDARETAQKRPDGLGNYTDHTEAHVMYAEDKYGVSSIIAKNFDFKNLREWKYSGEPIYLGPSIGGEVPVEEVPAE